jgi:hypothetical protein
MSTPEVQAKQASRALAEIRQALDRIEAKMGLADGSPPPPPVPVAPLTPEAKARKTLKTLVEIRDRLARIEAAAQPAEHRPAAPAVPHLNQSLRGDPLGKPKGR